MHVPAMCTGVYLLVPHLVIFPVFVWKRVSTATPAVDRVFVSPLFVFDFTNRNPDCACPDDGSIK